MRLNKAEVVVLNFWGSRKRQNMIKDVCSLTAYKTLFQLKEGNFIEAVLVVPTNTRCVHRRQGPVGRVFLQQGLVQFIRALKYWRKGKQVYNCPVFGIETSNQTHLPTPSAACTCGNVPHATARCHHKFIIVGYQHV